MSKPTNDQVIAIIDRLIKEGHTIPIRGGGGYEPLEPEQFERERFGRWATQIRFLIDSMGHSAGHLARLDPDAFNYDVCNWGRLAGVLHGLKAAIKADLLLKIEDLVMAEAFASLLEQAEYLLSRNHSLAAGVLGRAVLEKHLRKLCDRHGGIPAGRPTINDLNQALYQGKHLDKLAMQGITAMAAAGNHCAHNEQPPLPRAEVERFLRDVREFLGRHPA